MSNELEIPTGALAHQYFGRGDYHKAATCFAALHSQNPDDFDVLIAWANALSHASQKGEAAQVIEKAVARMDGASTSALQTLYQLAAANSPPHVRRAIAEKLSHAGLGDDLLISTLAADPQYRVPEWRRQFSEVAGRILSKSDSSTETIDLVCQLAAGAQDYATMCAGAEILSSRSLEERHLLAWIQGATVLGPDIDPHPIVFAATGRPLTSKLSKSLIEYASVCEIIGQHQAASKIYHLVLANADERPGAAISLARLTFALEGKEGLQKLYDYLAERYPDDDRVISVRLWMLWRLGRDEEVLSLTNRLSELEFEKRGYLIYSANILAVDDMQRAVQIFREVFANAEMSPEIEICLQDTVVRLLRDGLAPEEFLAEIGLSESHIRLRIALARVILSIEKSDTLRDDLLTVFGLQWASTTRILADYLRRSGVAQSNERVGKQIALASIRESDHAERRLAYGLLRNAALATESLEDAQVSLAWFNSRPSVNAGRIWTRAEATVDASESLKLWREIARKAPADPFVRRELDNARRAATPAILFAGLPRSGSVFVCTGLMGGLRKPLLGAVAGGAFPNFVLAQEGFQRMLNLRGSSHTHLSPLEVNLREIGQRYQLDRMLVHVRDPRQALLSWHDFLPGVIRTLDPTQASHYRLPSDYLEWSSERQLDWLVDNWLQVITDWIIGWARAPELDYFKTRILYTTFEDLVQDQSAFFRRILDFYGIDHDLFLEPTRERGVANYRQGLTDSWRSVLSPSQKRKAAEIVPAWLLEKFAWPLE